jgi:hypothetical protein
MPHNKGERPVHIPDHKYGPVPRSLAEIEEDSESDTGCPVFGKNLFRLSGRCFYKKY